MTRCTALEQFVRTLPPSRVLRWSTVDVRLVVHAQWTDPSELPWWRRGIIGGVVVTIAAIAFFGPLVAGATLLGGRPGPLPPAFTVPFAAVCMAFAVLAAALELTGARGNPRVRTRSFTTTTIALFGPICAVCVSGLAVLRAATGLVDPAVARIALLVIACATAALWLIGIVRLRLPATQTPALFDELRRARPERWRLVVADLDAALVILQERGRITAEEAAQARELGPGRLAAMDELRWRVRTRDAPGPR